MNHSDPLLCLERAREEAVHALFALCPERERFHRKALDRLIVEAMAAIRDNPEEKYDWGRMTMPTKQSI